MVKSPEDIDNQLDGDASGSGDRRAIALAHAFDVSDEPVYIYDPTGRCQWVNRSGEKLLHLEAAQIIGRYIYDLFPSQSHFQITAWRRVIDGKEPSSFIAESVIDGEMHQFKTSIFPVMDFGGGVQSVVSVGRMLADTETLQVEHQMRGAELNLINEITSILTARLDISDVYENFVAEFRKLVEFDRIVVTELTDSGKLLIPVFVSYVGSDEVTPGTSYKVQNSGMGWAVENQKTLIEDDLKVEARFKTDEILLAEGIRSAMRVPLITRSGVIGVMALGSYHPDMFGDRERAISERVAAQIAPAIENARLYQEAQNYANELEVIDEIANIITSSLRLDEVYERFASGVSRLVEFDRISVILIDEESGCVNQDYVDENKSIGLGRMGTGSLDDTPAGWVLKNCATLVEDDLSQSMRYVSDQVFLDAGVRSIIRVPLISNDCAIGAFALNSLSPNAFAPRSRRLLERLAAQIAPAIENARLYREAQERTHELKVIDDIASIMTSSLHIDEAYERFASEVKKLVPFNRMSVILIDAENQCSTLAYVTGLNPQVLKKNSSWPLKDSHLQKVIESRASLVSRDLSEEGGCEFPEDQWLMEAGLRSGIRAPMLNKNEVIGTFTLWSAAPNVYGPRERRIVERLADQIEPAIENARLYEEVEQAFKNLESAQEQLVRVERLRAMGELASGVAHDLNNGLAAILGRAQLLMNQISDEPSLRSLHLIEQAAQDSAHIVRRILDFARLDADTEFSLVDVNSLLEDVIDLTRHKWHDEAQIKGQVIEIRTNVGDVPLVFGDYAELREVLMNLVINSCQAVNGDGSIELGTSSSDGLVHIHITDSGVGMPPEVKKKIFDPFFSTKGSEGSGLGMSISLGIITRHNGTMDVESEENVGTRVRISLPVTDMIEEQDNDDTLSSSDSTRTARILVIEDEELIRETLHDMLELGNHKITLACDGEEGIAMFREAEFDIVFTDLGMPGLSGWEVSKAIKADRKDMPIVMVTGWGVGIDKSEMEENGVDEVLPKPFDIDIVLNLVQKLVQPN